MAQASDPAVKRKYHMTYMCPKHLDYREMIRGERQEQNVQVCELPKVGDRIYVYENTDLYRGMPQKAKDGTVVTAFYRPSESYSHYDGVVLCAEEFEVLGYTKGIENISDPGNFIELYHHYKNGGGYQTCIKAMLVAIGYYYLYKVSDDMREEIRQKLVSHYKGEKSGCLVRDRVKIEA